MPSRAPRSCTWVDHVSAGSAPAHAIPLRKYVSVAAGFTAAQTSVTASPYFLGALISARHFTDSSVGILYASEMLAFAASMLLVAPRINGLSLRAIALLGMVMIVGGQAGSAFVVDVTWLTVLRCAVGFGSGLLSASATAAGSRTAAPERIYAVATTTMTLVFAGLYIALAMAGHFQGPIGMFLLLAGFTALLIPLVILVPDEPVATATPVAGPRTAGSWRLLLPGLTALAAMLAYNYGALAVWPFTEQIGEHIGLSVDRISVLTAIGSAIAALGGVFATVVGVRFGRILPLTVGLLLQGIGSVAVCHAHTELGFLLTYSWYLGMWYFGYAYILSVAAAVDPPGRLAVLTGMGYPLSSALGGLSAGFLVESYSLSSIGWLAVAGCAVALALLVPLCRWIDRQALRATALPAT
jgi:MFS transporter, DHA1 family, inner membrane transport protein